MQSKLIVLLLCVLPVCKGCGSGEHATFTSPDHNDFVGPTGIVVAYDSDVPQGDPTFYDQQFAEARSCMLARGYIYQSYSGPVVRVVSFSPSGDHGGFTDFVNGQITINYISAQMYHESIHYLLLRGGLDNERNGNHDHPAFTECKPDLTKIVI